MNIPAVLPIIFPLITGLILALWQRSSVYRHAYMVISGIIQVVLSGYLVVKTAVDPVIVMALGGWKAPFGILLTIDHFAALLIAQQYHHTGCWGIHSGRIHNRAPLALALDAIYARGSLLVFFNR